MGGYIGGASAPGSEQLCFNAVGHHFADFGYLTRVPRALPAGLGGVGGMALSTWRLREAAGRGDVLEVQHQIEAGADVDDGGEVRAKLTLHQLFSFAAPSPGSPAPSF